MRSQTRRYTNDYPVLDLTSLHQKGFIENGRSGESSCKARERVLWSFGWHCTNESINVRYKLNDALYTHDIHIKRQLVNFGGERLFLNCPKCQSSRKQIYFVGGVAACRSCHGLHYRSQSESYQERKYRKLDRLLTKVHNFGYRFDGHWKAKGKHWSKYHEIDSQINYLQQSIFRDIDKRFGLGEAARHFG
tara:strand:+ start:2120 stop:2692 length:573 start_codon:yes stop_codon:yes gene_type:complete